jgi:hypothetical protein
MIIQNLYDMALANPWWAALIALMLMCCGTGLALCLVGLVRPELPLHQWEDDDDQLRAVTRPAALEKPAHQVHIKPADDLIPWGRRVHGVERQP